MVERKLWIPISKSEGSDIYAILSDNSVDRDEEIISKELLTKWASNPNKYLPALVNHENKVENLVGEWTDAKLIRSVEKPDYYALRLKPKFYMSNPKATLVSDLLEDGARLGVSIGAILGDKPFKTVKRNGKEYRMWVDAELVEASFTPIPSNRQAYVTAIAKSFGMDKLSTVSNEYPAEHFKEDVLNDSEESKMTEEDKIKPEEVQEKPEVVEEKEDKEDKLLSAITSLSARLEAIEAKQVKEKEEEEEEEEKEEAEKSAKLLAEKERRVQLKHVVEQTTAAKKPLTKEVYSLEDLQTLSFK